MESIKTAIKSAIKNLATGAADMDVTYAGEAEEAERLSRAVANLTNSLSAIVVIEDQELHNAQIGKPDQIAPKVMH